MTIQNILSKILLVLLVLLAILLRELPAPVLCKKAVYTAKDIQPSSSDLRVVGVFNCRAALFKGEPMLLLRIAESAFPKDDLLNSPESMKYVRLLELPNGRIVVCRDFLPCEVKRPDLEDVLFSFQYPKISFQKQMFFTQPYTKGLANILR